jgi:hypothetical protein
MSRDPINIGDVILPSQVFPGLVIETDRAVRRGRNWQPSADEVQRIAVVSVMAGTGANVVMSDGITEWETAADWPVRVVGRFNP